VRTRVLGETLGLPVYEVATTDEDGEIKVRNKTTDDAQERKRSTPQARRPLPSSSVSLVKEDAAV